MQKHLMHTTCAIYFEEIAAMIKAYRADNPEFRSDLITKFIAKFGKTTTNRIVGIASEIYGNSEGTFRATRMLPDSIVDIVFGRSRQEWEEWDKEQNSQPE